MTLSIYIPVWDTHCHIVLRAKDLPRELTRLKVTPKDIEEVIETECSAITFDNTKGDAVIVIKRAMPYAELIGTIAHEAFHAADCLLADRDVFLRRGDHNEAHAYLLGFITEMAVTRLKR